MSCVCMYVHTVFDVDGGFAKDIRRLSFCSTNQILDDAKNHDQPITASQVKNQASLSDYVCKDKAYRFMKHVRGSLAY